MAHSFKGLCLLSLDCYWSLRAEHPWTGRTWGRGQVTQLMTGRDWRWTGRQGGAGPKICSSKIILRDPLSSARTPSSRSHHLTNHQRIRPMVKLWIKNPRDIITLQEFNQMGIISSTYGQPGMLCIQARPCSHLPITVGRLLPGS